MLLKEAYNKGKNLLTLNNINVNLELRLLLQHILNINEANFLANYNLKITPSQYNNLSKLISLRNTGYPLAYILGYKYFWKDKFLVTPNVLIPRAETELLIEVIVNLYKTNLNFPYNILEIGVGCGCVLASLLKELPQSVGIGVDISKEALLVAKSNLKKLNLNIPRVFLLQQNLFSSLLPQKKFDIIVSNPPYISYEDNMIQEEVKKFEPKVALFASCNGLYFYKKLLNRAKKYLAPKGNLILEIGINQKEEIIKLSQNSGLIFKESIKDSLKIDRVLVFSKVRPKRKKYFSLVTK